MVFDKNHEIKGHADLLDMPGNAVQCLDACPVRHFSPGCDYPTLHFPGVNKRRAGHAIQSPNLVLAYRA